MIQWKKLKNGLAVLLAVTMVGQPVGVYAEELRGGRNRYAA